MKTLCIALIAALFGVTSCKKQSSTPASNNSSRQIEDASVVVSQALATAARQATNSNLPNHSTTAVGNQIVSVASDIPVSSSAEANRAVIQIGQRRLIIEFEKQQILLDDKPTGRLPSATKVVEVQASGGKVVVTADGKEVLAQ